jgi:predicted GNAT superfamily acetyltransferase
VVKQWQESILPGLCLCLRNCKSIIEGEAVPPSKELRESMVEVYTIFLSGGIKIIDHSRTYELVHVVFKKDQGNISILTETFIRILYNKVRR